MDEKCGFCDKYVNDMKWVRSLAEESEANNKQQKLEQLWQLFKPVAQDIKLGGSVFEGSIEVLESRDYEQLNTLLVELINLDE